MEGQASQNTSTERSRHLSLRMEGKSLEAQDVLNEEGGMERTARKKARYIHGNYPNYYGYRVSSGMM